MPTWCSQGGSRHVSFALEVQLARGAPYSARRRYSEFKALHAALVQRCGKAALPALPPGDPFSLLRSPDRDFLRARAAALHSFVQQLVTSPRTAAAAETRRFLDTEARPALGDEELPATLFHLVQGGLQRRLPLRTQLDLDRRAARCTDARFSLLLRLHGGGLLLLACAADPEPWLGEMRDLVEETREAHFPELQLVATTLSEDDVAPWSPGTSPSPDNELPAIF